MSPASLLPPHLPWVLALTDGVCSGSFNERSCKSIRSKPRRGCWRAEGRVSWEVRLSAGAFVPLETSELLKLGLLSAANKWVTTACNQAQELLAKRSLPCADGCTEGGCPQSGGRSTQHLSYMFTSENLRKT